VVNKSVINQAHCFKHCGQQISDQSGTCFRYCGQQISDQSGTLLQTLWPTIQ
jgi:hypothetical protein